MSESVLNNWGAVTVAALIVVGWVVVTCVQKSCSHEYAEEGDVKPIHRRSDVTGRGAPVGFSHLLRCKKCGSLKTFDRWAVADHYAL